MGRCASDSESSQGLAEERLSARTLSRVTEKGNEDRYNRGRAVRARLLSHRHHHASRHLYERHPTRPFSHSHLSFSPRLRSRPRGPFHDLISFSVPPLLAAPPPRHVEDVLLLHSRPRSGLLLLTPVLCLSRPCRGNSMVHVPP